MGQKKWQPATLAHTIEWQNEKTQRENWNKQTNGNNSNTIIYKYSIFSIICAYTISSNFAHASKTSEFSMFFFYFSLPQVEKWKLIHTHKSTLYTLILLINISHSLPENTHTHLIVCNKIKMPDNSWVYYFVCLVSWLPTCLPACLLDFALFRSHFIFI